MAKIISRRQSVWHKHLCHDFTWKHDPDGGFSFPVDENGNLIGCVIGEEPNEVAIKNYKYCLSHPEELTDNGIEDRGWYYTEPAHAICDKCGREIILNGDTECECGQWHNAFGQELLPPKYWWNEMYCEEDY